MPTALILGASRGIGHELARQYRADGWRVIATARKQADLDELAHLGAEPIALDVTNVDAIAGFAWKLDDEKIDAAWLDEYNTVRRHSTNHMLSPVDYERAQAKRQAHPQEAA